MIDRKHKLPIKRQAEVLSTSRGTAYYKPRPVSDQDLLLLGKLVRLATWFGPLRQFVLAHHIIWFHRSIQALQDGRVHLLRVRERTIAVANDVEVSKVKVGGEPNIGHHQII